MSDGKTAEARAVLGKILKAEPDDGATYLRLGRLDRQEGNFDQARQELEHAKSLMRDNLEVPYELVLLEDALGNDDKAVLILQDILKQSEKPNGQYTASEANNRAVFIERLGLIYRSQEKYDLALGVFKQMLALGKSQAPRGEGLIVETLRLNRQPQKALEEAELALKKVPAALSGILNSHRLRRSIRRHGDSRTLKLPQRRLSARALNLTIRSMGISYWGRFTNGKRSTIWQRGNSKRC